MNKPKGIRRSDLKPCASCGQGLMHAGPNVAYRVTIEAFFPNLPAIQRAHGMEQVMNGNVAIATVMGPDEDLFVQLGEQDKGLICCECAMMVPFGSIIERLAAPAEDKRGEGL